MRLDSVPASTTCFHNLTIEADTFEVIQVDALQSAVRTSSTGPQKRTPRRGCARRQSLLELPLLLGR